MPAASVRRTTAQPSSVTIEPILCKWSAHGHECARLAGDCGGCRLSEQDETALFHHDAGSTVICAKLESDLVDLSADEAKEYLKEYGVTDSGFSALIRGTYDLLGLMTYFTAGEKEVRAWTIHKGWKAPQAAGVIHSDFEKGFIKAEIVSYEDLSRLGSVAAAREAGKYRLEGKEYVFRDGDVALFRFNT